MKPVNSFEIRKSSRLFVLSFLLLTTFSIGCIYLFFIASDKEYTLLEQKVKETESLYTLRRDINSNFDRILLRFNELNKYHNYNADELSRQGMLLEDIQNANFKLRDLIARKPKNSPSFELYEKLNNGVSVMAGLQDSLFTSRYTIENSKEQLSNCLNGNQAAANRIRSGRFGK